MVPDKQSKMVLLKYSFCEDICEKRDSAQCDTGWSQTLRSITLCGVGKLKCPRIQIGLKLGGVNQFDLIFPNFNFQDYVRAEFNSAQRDTLQSPTPSSITLHGVDI